MSGSYGPASLQPGSDELTGQRLCLADNLLDGHHRPPAHRRRQLSGHGVPDVTEPPLPHVARTALPICRGGRVTELA